MEFKLALVLILGIVSCATALPARKRMVYYQQPGRVYSNPAQHMMYVQYVQPATHNGYGRSTQAASALVAGEAVATRTYLEDCEPGVAHPAEAAPSVSAEVATDEQRGEDVLGDAGAHAVQSVAEAYLDENVQTAITDDETPAVIADIVPDEIPTTASAVGVKSPRDLFYETEVGAHEETPTVGVDSLPAPVPLAPVAAPAPPRTYVPSKKVYVELDPTVEDSAEDAADNTIPTSEEVAAEEESNETDLLPAPVQPQQPRRVPAARQPAVRRTQTAVRAGAPAKPSLPAGTFFPIDFGGTSGGAIAIANSFSTGEGGSATSHAIAYGSPDMARTRLRKTH